MTRITIQTAREVIMLSVSTALLDNELYHNSIHNFLYDIIGWL